MLFSKFAEFLSRLEQTSSRNEMTEILAEMFAQSTTNQIDELCYLSLGRLAPKYEDLKLNLGEKMMTRVLARAFNLEENEIASQFNQLGDLGDVAYQLKSVKKSRNKLKVAEVFEQLVEIAEEEGTGSQERKINKTAALINALDPLGAKYLVRIPLEKLRLGFSDITILDGLSWMEAGDKSLRPEIESAYNVLADIGTIAKIFKKQGLKGIQEVESEPGVPIRPALAERLSTPEEILEKLEGECVLEPKYDGFRVQIHYDRHKETARKKTDKQTSILNNSTAEEKGFVRVFSRNLDDTTHMFPDLVEAVQKLSVDSIILDGEAIAYDPESDRFLPFQKTVQRKRKYQIEQKAKEIPLKVFLFDVLYLNGKPLLNTSFRERREKLANIITKKGQLILTQQKKVDQEGQFNQFFNDVVEEGLEGLVAKKLDAVYQAGARNYTWVKYKAAMESELADTVDCVVMGYYPGKGKRSDFGIGAFLAGIRKNEQIVTVSKIGTGLTDQQWRELKKKCDQVKAEQKPDQYRVDDNIAPDIWCYPEIVVEIEADEITDSPLHTAGLALRFPRLKRYRNDKDPDQITTQEELQKLSEL
jgi:DNA ligase-1